MFVTFQPQTFDMTHSTLFSDITYKHEFLRKLIRGKTYLKVAVDRTIASSGKGFIVLFKL